MKGSKRIHDHQGVNTGITSQSKTTTQITPRLEYQGRAAAERKPLLSQSAAPRDTQRLEGCEDLYITLVAMQLPYHYKQANLKLYR